MKKIKLHNLSGKFANYFLLVALILTFVLFGSINPSFLSYTNILDILRTASIVGILGIGGSFVQCTGETNFAVGTQATVAATIMGLIMMYVPDQFYWPMLIVPIAASMVIGALMGVAINKLKMSSFLCTVTLEMILTSFCRFATNNAVLYSSNWGKNFIFLGQTQVFGVIPMPAIVFILIAVIAHFYKEHTRQGRYNFAVGANAATARQVGINVEREKVKAFAICGGFCGVGGIILLSLFNNVNMTMGTYYKFPGICATVLSAAFWKIGKYNVPGSVIAAILIVAIQNGVITIGGSYYYKEIVQGILLVIALLIVAAIREDGLPKVSFTAE